MNIEKKYDVAIIGAGIAGLTLAVLLAKAGVKLALVEPQKIPPISAIKPTGRTVALMNTSLNIIKAVDAWPAVEDFAAPLKAMEVIDDSVAGRDTIHNEFPASDIGLEQFGYNIPNGLLRSAIFEQAKKQKNITLHDGAFLSSINHQNQHIEAELDNGTVIKTQVLIGADGRNSKTRELVGIEAKTTTYNQAAITCLINHSRSHENVSAEFHRPAGPLALVPLPGNQSSIVWVETPQRAEELTKLKKSEFEHALQAAMNDRLGGITLEAGPESWPLSAIKAQSLTAPRIALIAEAAHVMSPITAQGLNLSLRDVAALAETVIDAMRAGIDPGHASTLKAYEKRRRLDIETRTFGVDGMNKLVSNDIPALKGLRRASFKAMDVLTPLRLFAMEQALAPTIDKGRLARGESL